jgi:hypothetical protein
MSQLSQIRAHLQKGYTLTPIEALEMFGCFRLGARIDNLRRAGMEIKTTICRRGKKQWASYRLEAISDG